MFRDSPRIVINYYLSCHKLHHTNNCSLVTNLFDKNCTSRPYEITNQIDLYSAFSKWWDEYLLIDCYTVKQFLEDQENPHDMISQQLDWIIGNADNSQVNTWLTRGSWFSKLQKKSWILYSELLIITRWCISTNNITAKDQ